MAHDAGLQGRIRSLLAGRPDVEEKRMVGGMSFVVGGHLCAGVKRDALLVRVAPAADEAALAEPGVRPLEFGGKHPLGYVLVEPAAIRSDDSLRAWVDRGLAFVASQPTPRARTTR